MPSGNLTVLPATDTPAFLRVKAILDDRDRVEPGWISTTETTVLILKALAYEDGADEDAAIAAGRAIRVDPVLAIECVDEWLKAVLGVRA